MVVSAVVGVVLVLVALALGAVGVAGLTARLPRNRFAGVRTPAAMTSDETFRVANRVAAPLVLAGAGVLVLGVVGLFAFGTLAGLLVSALCLVVAVGGVVSGGVAGTRAAATVPEADCGTPTACASCTGCSLAVAH